LFGGWSITGDDGTSGSGSGAEYRCIDGRGLELGGRAVRSVDDASKVILRKTAITATWKGLADNKVNVDGEPSLAHMHEGKQEESGKRRNKRKGKKV
jgi:hypothetical protein